MKLKAQERKIIQCVACLIGCISFLRALFSAFFQVIIKNYWVSQDCEAISGFVLISSADAADAHETVRQAVIIAQERNIIQWVACLIGCISFFTAL